MNFDAFISYSRAGSAKEARALKIGLERYARPWNRARSTRVFLDDASLSAAPSLTGTLLQSLTESEWLIVLLTEEAAQSPELHRFSALGCGAFWRCRLGSRVWR